MGNTWLTRTSNRRGEREPNQSTVHAWEGELSLLSGPLAVVGDSSEDHPSTSPICAVFLTAGHPRVITMSRASTSDTRTIKTKVNHLIYVCQLATFEDGICWAVVCVCVWALWPKGTSLFGTSRSMYHSPLCLVPVPSFLPVCLSWIRRIFQSTVTRQSKSSIKWLIDTRLTGKAGTCKTDESSINGVLH